MRKPKFAGPCIVCGQAEKHSKWYKRQMCNNCYRKARRRERGLKPSAVKREFGPCSNCGSTTSAKDLWVRGLCRACYKRIVIRNGPVEPRAKYNGPCEKCGLSDPAKSYIRKLCPKCYKWYRNNVTMDNRRRRIRKAAAISELTEEQWVRVLEHFEYRCAYCDKDIRNSFTMDHVIPLSKGGTHTFDNVVPACLSCNSAKSDREPPRPVSTLKE